MLLLLSVGNASIAQSVERPAVNRQVTSSSLVGGAIFLCLKTFPDPVYYSASGFFSYYLRFVDCLFLHKTRALLIVTYFVS